MSQASIPRPVACPHCLMAGNIFELVKYETVIELDGTLLATYLFRCTQCGEQSNNDPGNKVVIGGRSL